MKKPALVILAAGMGSRYGGLKQMDPMDPMGHAIIDYSIYDAKRAGFGKVVFVIKKAIEKDFKETVGARVPEDDSLLIEEEKKHERHTNMYAAAVFQLILAIGLGTIFSWLLTKTGLTFPIYIGAMIAAALIRNIGEYSGKFTIHMGEINDLGGIALSLFLGIAMITLKLWQLASLALPLFILLTSQVILICLFTYFVEFNIMGRDYDAAVLVAGTCGFGMGAFPTPMV